MGGNTPQLLVNKAALAISSGRADVAIVCGGESYRTRMAARKTDGGRSTDLADPAERRTADLG